MFWRPPSGSFGRHLYSLECIGRPSLKYFGYFLTNKRSIYSWGLVTFAFGMSYLSYFENFSKAILTLLASVHCGQWSPLSLEALLVMALIYVVWDRRDGGSGEP